MRALIIGVYTLGAWLMVYALVNLGLRLLQWWGL